MSQITRLEILLQIAPAPSARRSSLQSPTARPGRRVLRPSSQGRRVRACSPDPRRPAPPSRVACPRSMIRASSCRPLKANLAGRAPVVRGAAPGLPARLGRRLAKRSITGWRPTCAGSCSRPVAPRSIGCASRRASRIGVARSRNATLPANQALVRNAPLRVMADRLEDQSLPPWRESLPSSPPAVWHFSPVHESKTKAPSAFSGVRAGSPL